MHAMCYITYIYSLPVIKIHIHNNYSMKVKMFKSMSVGLAAAGAAIALGSCGGEQQAPAKQVPQVAVMTVFDSMTFSALKKIFAKHKKIKKRE